MPESSFHQTLPVAQETDWICCTKIILLLETQTDYERTTYLEPLNQLKWLAVILVCFKDDISQFMYDHIQRSLIFNGFGEVKLKKPERNLLLIYGRCEVLVPATTHGTPATQKAFTLHAAFILVCYPNPLEFIFYWIPENFTQTFISQQCRSDSMKKLWTHWRAPFIQTPPHASPPWANISFFRSLSQSLDMQKEWANKDYHH